MIDCCCDDLYTCVSCKWKGKVIMTTTRIYYSEYFDLIMTIELETWFHVVSNKELSSEWEYVGEL
jgi:hypothetical protein